ncbi:arsenical pump membrane protein [Ensifer sp. KUDG1]|uniref:arsenic transporter n=1 Tax=Ensifer sp. KUDG1 TaxID=3373919 RepID=UPI003D1B80A8
MGATVMTWGIGGLTVLAVVSRPFGWPEAIWAVTGACLLVACRLIGLADVWLGLTKATDVCLFLVGMMLLSELARQEGLFDWIASVATAHANGSPRRLFVLIYAFGIVVTVFLSNDATAVVLTPAVYAACRTAKVRDPLPYLLICAFTANAASFVLPISNPANFVIFGDGDMPTLWNWLVRFWLPSLVSVIVTFVALYWTQRSALAADSVSFAERPTLSGNARLTGVAILATAALLAVASERGYALGLTTFVIGSASVVVVLFLKRRSPFALLSGISWSVLPLVAGLFIIVEGLDGSGLTERLGAILADLASTSPNVAAAGIGGLAAVLSNAINNLPAGLLGAGVVHTAGASDKIAAALIGVDLGPNLSISGSLATMLWLAALRREGLECSARAFLKLGVIVMPPALFLSLLCLVLT